jgi:hypothetical protein
MADTPSGTRSLPVFESGKTYFLTGETLKMIVDVIKENRVVLTDNLKYSEVGPDGSKLPLKTVDLAVCINGATQILKFVTLGSGNTPPA